MTAAASIRGYADHPKEDHFVRLRGVTWADYQRLLEIRGERASPRMTYLEGLLEIMTPSKQHESYKSKIGRLVEVWCLHQNVDFSPYGSWTLKDAAVERGVEPDECYVFGSNPDAERPDLAIEVVWTSGGIDKLQVYRKLNVREIWFWEKGTLSPYVLRADRYEAAERSELLPALDLAELVRFLDIEPTSRAVREYRAALSRG